MSLQSNTAAPPGVVASRATIKRVAITDPAAAAEFSLTVPSTVAAYELLAVSGVLTSNASGTPWPSLVIDDGTNILARLLSGSAAQAISLACQHTWARGLIQGGAASDLAKTGGLPDGLVLPSGYRIRSLTASIETTDDWSALSALVVEYSN